MGKKKETTASKTPALKVSSECRKKLSEMREEIALMDAELNHARTEYQLLLTRALKDLCVPINNSMICLECGLVGINGRPCSKCMER